MRSRWIIAAILLVFSSTSPSAQQSHVDTRQQIDQMALKFNEHYNNGDAAAIARMFTNDAMRVSPELNGVSTGSQAIKESLQTQLNSGFSRIDLLVDQVSTLGTDAVVTVGGYQLTGQDQTGPLKVEGNWSGVAEQSGGACDHRAYRRPQCGSWTCNNVQIRPGMLAPVLDLSLRSGGFFLEARRRVLTDRAGHPTSKGN